MEASAQQVCPVGVSILLLFRDTLVVGWIRTNTGICGTSAVVSLSVLTVGDLLALLPEPPRLLLPESECRLLCL